MEVLIVVLVVGVGYLLTTSGAASGSTAGTGAGSGTGLGGMFGGKLGASDIATYASSAGFSGNDLVTAVAVALAESGGDPSIPGDNGTSMGLWQIHFTVHPQFNGWDLTDPQTNANAAYSLYNARGGTFTDWTTYNTGKYTTFLGEASNGVAAIGG
jgi:hypothetical protein